MPGFIGEYECTLDTKGRIMLPAALRKQFPRSAKSLIIKRGFEKCLILYTREEWAVISKRVNDLNDFVRNNRKFKRYYFQGATEVSVDGIGRILIPKQHQEDAGLDEDIVLFAYSNQIEIWDKAEYTRLLKSEPEDFSVLAEEVMGNTKKD